MLRKSIATAAILAAVGMTGQASGQANTCQGRATIDAIQQSHWGGSTYDDLIHIRNATNRSITVDVSFSGFPDNVTLFSPVLPGIPIGLDATRSSLKFGRGTSNQVSVSTVTRVSDAAAGGGPTVRLTNCRAG